MKGEDVSPLQPLLAPGIGQFHKKVTEFSFMWV